MQEKFTMSSFEELVKKACSCLFEEIENRGNGKRWERAILDARISSKKGFAWISKFLVYYSDGSIDASGPPYEATDALGDAFERRNKVFAKKWYGLKLTLDPEGDVKREYNYDPNCNHDPQFYTPVVAATPTETKGGTRRKPKSLKPKKPT